MIQLPNDDAANQDSSQPGRGARNTNPGENASAPGGVNMASVLEALRKTKAGMQRLGDRLSEPLAVVGIGCRFPEAASPDEFWNLLQNGQAADTHAGDRWSSELTADQEKQPGRITANRVGWLDQIDQFDAAFFGISGREASTLDPQQRLLLEVAWETFENAGISPQSCRGRRVGAFVGMCSNDYLHRLTRRDPEEIDTYMSTGNAHGAAAGRLSYVMDWRGPSVAVDTACSSSLTAVHLATRSLRYGDCDMAIAMGVNVILAPELSISLSQAGMLSPTGRCHAFSSDADGFVRGEGCGAVLLKRLSDAVRDNDPIYCVVRGSATNQDGRSVGLTAPNGHAQQAVIRAAIADARLSTDQIDYLETHGTGTPLGDPIEVDALRQVFASSREPSRPLRIGSVKTNVGHLEGAAGIAGMIKVILSLKNRCLPPHLHCEKLSEAIDWSWPVEITRTTQSWESPQPRVAGVSSFGFGGSNAHVILSDAPTVHPLSPAAPSDGTVIARPVGTALELVSSTEPHSDSEPSLFVLSAKSPMALRQYASKFVDALSVQPQRLGDVCFSAATTRDHFEHRIAVVTDSVEKLIDELRRFADGNPSSQIISEVSASENRLVGDDRVCRLRGVAMSFLRGETIDWKEYFAPTSRRVVLPTYPFQRSRRWLDDAPVCLPSSALRQPSNDPATPNSTTQNAAPVAGAAAMAVAVELPSLLQRKLNLAGDETIFETDLSCYPYLNDHVVRGMTLFPAAGLVELALAAAGDVDPSLNAIESLQIQRPLSVRLGESTWVQIIVSAGEQQRRLRIATLDSTADQPTWKIVAECHVASKPNRVSVNRTAAINESQLDTFTPDHEITREAHYAAMHGAGIDYGQAFQGVQSRRDAVIGDQVVSFGETRLPSMLDSNGYRFHPAWLDACFQVAAGLISDSANAWIPVGIDQVCLHRDTDSNRLLRVMTTRRVRDDATSGDEHMTINLSITDEQGNAVMTIERLRLAPIAILPSATSSSGRPTCETHPDTPGRNTPAEIRIYLHERIADIMGLELDEVPLAQSLDALGLDSLMAFELRDEMQQEFGIEVPLDLFFEANTLDTFLNQVIERIAIADPPKANHDGWVEGAL
ncbi:type I polyketide synthase [Aporhodopirellula aestuarii]|uniref:Polyketide synthase dehydratase domain-containing protein n=1 Tax=Aporhodopirellula aestuarii TaxID=2950107 RepID=A0ABT0UAB9_9BACT|nr:beta-ketoacyl synthase N-terminal-like domain-containing protein [Aporhodopirellula aestuarii]MCM2373286.1 polyketide synthase dehydratase domain-containing protein [Aporhodopirellula aestuarii]